MGNSKNSHVFKLVILMKSQKFDAREKYTCFTVYKCLNDDEQHAINTVTGNKTSFTL